jgi:hypothetical protein
MGMRIRGRLLRRLAALVCTAPLLAAWAGAAAADVTLSQPVRDAAGRFTMTFPPDWDVTSRTQGIVALFGAGPVRDGHRPSVNVVTEVLPGPMSPDAYAEAAGRLAKATFHNYTVIQESSAAIQGRPAFYRYLTWETNTGIALYQLQVFVTAGQTGYVITGTTLNDHDRITQDMPLVTQIIQTFQVLSTGN